MSKERKIRCYDYVNHSYAQVRDALKKDAAAVFQSATKTAVSRAHSIASELHVNLAGLEVGTDISICVNDIQEQPGKLKSPPVTRLQLEWQASRAPHLFPLMRAELRIYPLTATETQLDFSGHYEPPLGVLGSALDAIAGHRLAEASVHEFITDVAAYLRKVLGSKPGRLSQ